MPVYVFVVLAMYLPAFPLAALQTVRDLSDRLTLSDQPGESVQRDERKPGVVVHVSVAHTPVQIELHEQRVTRDLRLLKLLARRVQNFQPHRLPPILPRTFPVIAIRPATSAA